MAEESMGRPPQKQYDYLLKFLLVGDSDVGKQEILSDLEDGSSESPFCSGSGMFIYSIFSLFAKIPLCPTTLKFKLYIIHIIQLLLGLKIINNRLFNPSLVHNTTYFCL